MMSPRCISSGRTLDYASRIYLTTGDKLYSNRSNVMLDIVEDTVGRHDFLLTPCSKDTFRIIYGDTDPHRGCFGNLAAALAPYGVSEDMIPVAFNCFMNVPINGETGELTVEPPLSKAGDRIVFEAQADLDHRPHRLFGAAIEQRKLQADSLRNRPVSAYSAALAADFSAFDDAPPAPALSALARICLTYAWRHRRLPRIAAPMRFTDLVQWRKLFDHDPRQPRLADKVAAKDYARRLLGDDWITPTLWQGDRLPEQIEWPGPFVVKSRHGCNQTRFVRGGAEDWDEIRRAAAGWMKTRYGYWLDEWLYREIPRGILVEPFIGDRGSLPVDYKLYVFGGRVTHIQVHLDREHDHRWTLFTPDWRRRSAASAMPTRRAPPRSTR